jgi:SpoIID/LytB domain protein
VENKPKVFCNVSEYQIPSVLNGAVKYFRWEETYNRKRLEEIIRRKTRVDIGTFVGIEPLKRGTSGRLIEIEILGTRTNLTIKNELNIRKSLSESALKSSCFYVTMTYDDDGIPVEVTFHGAGWGHGVGMCQVGAAVMATEGFNYRQILEHYYPGSKLEKFYSIDSLKVELK